MIALALQTAATFNLVCSGMLHLDEARGSGLPGSYAPFSVVLRVDIQRQLWCADDCQTLRALSRLTQSRIVFEALENRDRSTLTTVDRESGAFSDQTLRRARGAAGRDFVETRTGTCERAPFSGFPPHRP